MDQMAIDTIGMTLERNQSILLKLLIFGGGSLIVWDANSSSGCLELQFPSKPMNTTEYIIVLSCSLLPFLRENSEKKYMFSNRIISELMAAARV